MNSTFNRSHDDLSVESARRNLRVIASCLIWSAAFLFFLSNMGINITTFITGLGIGGIAIALAVQSMLGDVLSSFSIAVDKPFEVGDFVVVDTLKGTVEHIGLKTTRIRSLGGELLILPNSDLGNARVQNYKKMNSRRILFRIGVVYGTPVDKLRKIPEIIKDIITKVDQVDVERVHFLEFGDFSLIFEIVYHVRSSDYAVYCEKQQMINLEIAEIFEGEGVSMAFPTQSLHIESLPVSAKGLPL